MNQKKFLAVASLATCAAAVAAFVVPTAGAAGSAGTTVTVRVEGLNHTLLPPTSVTTQAGWITKGGTPKGKCPATSAAGALDVATHHNWGAKYESSFGDIEVLSILGETHKFTSKYYWEILANNVTASKGACQLKLHAGEQLLFAAVPDKPTEYPTALTAPSQASKGVPFKVKVVWFNAKGKAKPLTSLTITATNTGTLMLQATNKGYIRSAQVPVTVF